jgi:hypothetical protein
MCAFYGRSGDEVEEKSAGKSTQFAVENRLKEADFARKIVNFPDVDIPQVQL